MTKTAKNNITGDLIKTKPSNMYSDNYDGIFRKKVSYWFIYDDGMDITKEFDNQIEADNYIQDNTSNIKAYSKIEMLLG